MRRVSDRQARINRRIATIKRRKMERNGGRCLVTGEGFGIVDAAHLIRRSYSLTLADDERNIIPLNREVHEVFDNGDSEAFLPLYERYMWKWEAIFERMYSLDELYTRRLLQRLGLFVD